MAVAERGCRFPPVRSLSWLGWLALFLTLPVLAGQGGAVVVDVDNGDPPFMSDAMGQAVGLYPRLVETVFTSAGVPVEIRAMPWKRALQELDGGRAAVAGLYKTNARLSAYDFSDPLFNERIVVVYDRRRPIDFHSLKDLGGKTIGVIAGWSYGDAFDNALKRGAFSTSAVQTDAQNLEKLALGRVDAVLTIDEVAHALIRGKHLAQLDVSAAALADNATYLAFNKQAHETALLQLFNSRLKALKRTRDYQEWVERSLMSTSGPKF